MGNFGSVTRVRCICRDFTGRIVGEASSFPATLVPSACHCETGVHGHQVVGLSILQEGSGRFVRSRKVASGARGCSGAFAKRLSVL